MDMLLSLGGSPVGRMSPITLSRTVIHPKLITLSHESCSPLTVFPVSPNPPNDPLSLSQLGE